jgi:hypothetical protein
MSFFDWYPIAKEISGEDPLFILIPLLLLIFWYISYLTHRYTAMFFWSVLLVVVTLPPIISFIAHWLGRSDLFGLRFSSFTLFEGLVSFVVGTLAIFESIALLRRI